MRRESPQSTQVYRADGGPVGSRWMSPYCQAFDWLSPQACGRQPCFEFTYLLHARTRHFACNSRVLRASLTRQSMAPLGRSRPARCEEMFIFPSRTDQKVPRVRRSCPQPNASNSGNLGNSGNFLTGRESRCEYFSRQPPSLAPWSSAPCFCGRNPERETSERLELVTVSGMAFVDRPQTHNPFADANRSVGGLADNLTDALGPQGPGGQRGPRGSTAAPREERLRLHWRLAAQLGSRAYRSRRFGTRVKQDTEILHSENLPAEPLVDRLANRSNAIGCIVAHFIRGEERRKVDRRADTSASPLLWELQLMTTRS